MPCTMLTSGNTFACVNPGFRNSSNDNTRPTTLRTFPFGGGDGDTCVVDVVCESVFVPVALVGADPVVADAPAVGAELVSVDVLVVGVVSEFDAVVGVSTVASEDWVIWAGVLEVGVVCALAGLTACVVADAVAVFTGLIGLVGLVGLFKLFLQVSDVVTQGCHTGLPYGSGHIEERVWVMLPV
jgi:hypothetical protein